MLHRRNEQEQAVVVRVADTSFVGEPDESLEEGCLLKCSFDRARQQRHRMSDECRGVLDGVCGATVGGGCVE